jgi:hypothetical protein
MRGLPRFGHSRNFADFFGTEAQTVDYLWGLIFAGMFLFAIFVAWSVLLVVFKCVGKKGVGFLSGAPFEKSTTKNRRCCNNSRWCNRPLISRIVFVVATVLFIVFSVLFVTEGLTNLKSTVTTLVDSARVSLGLLLLLSIHIHIQRAQPHPLGSFIRMSTKL